jgi:hypothetical protein
MNSEEFVEGIKREVTSSAVDGMMSQINVPSGRRPGQRLLRLSRWYKNLSADDQTLLREALEYAADNAVFGFFCVLDGVRTVEDGRSKGTFDLVYRKNGSTLLLNDPAKEELHNLYNSIRTNIE